ncbi:MAG: acyl-CoA dehydrogenase family protein [Alphaproteobacteria bacterium]
MASPQSTPVSPAKEALLDECRAALGALKTLIEAAADALQTRVTKDAKLDAERLDPERLDPERLDPERLDAEQFAAHGFAWLATYGAALEQLFGWAERLEAAGRLGALERLILQAGFGEYLAQCSSGIAMSQVEIVRPADLGLDEKALGAFKTPEVRSLIARGNTAETRAAIAEEIRESAHFGDPGFEDETLDAMRDQIRRFADERIAPHAQDWHRADRLIPLEVIEEMAALGVFGLTTPEAYGGLGLGKVAMCVVTEELSRGYLSVGSIGTRSEIAAELILQAGTDEQKQRWLPGIASGAVLPSAVFTEPNTGSDLGSLKTRALKEGDRYLITGNKTWTTHGARSDLMTLMARTDGGETGYRGLSLFLAEKPRGTDDDPFPADGMSGSEIPVLGYRGMKEYEIAFDRYPVPADGLLGLREGEGFKQLMRTFEVARIQTTARSVGVAQNALELGLGYARERVQFGKPIYAFPRVSGKLAWIAVEVMIARQLGLFAAREKDAGRRSDMVAGMAKLLAGRVAWAAADAAVQIHGGNGYAEEYPVSRVLCDARILSIFEGAAEIQAHIIARRLLSA